MVAARRPSAFPWPDFAAGATEIQIAIAASGSPYGRTNRRELLAKAAHGTKVTAKVSRQFRNVRSRRRLLEGLLAVQEGRSEDAATAFARATEIADAMHLPYDRARADLETARLGRLGEHERTAALDRAAASFEALGALDQLRQVETLR